MKRDTFLSPAFRRTARPIDEAGALALLRAGVAGAKVAKAFGVRLSRIYEIGRRGGVEFVHGRRPMPIDEAAVLERLQAGENAMRIARSLGVHYRRIVRLAAEHGIEARRRHRRSAAELAAQDGRIRYLRSIGKSWVQIAQALGYGDPMSGRIAVRNRARRIDLVANEPDHNAKRARHLMRLLRNANDGRAGWEDLDSFKRMAANERRHWLLRPAEIELARRFRLLPPHCVDVPARVLIDRSLHMPPACPTPRLNLLASGF